MAFVISAIAAHFASLNGFTIAIQDKSLWMVLIPTGLLLWIAFCNWANPYVTNYFRKKQ